MPTWTVTSAESVPLAVTLPTMWRFSTGAVLYCDLGRRGGSRASARTRRRRRRRGGARRRARECVSSCRRSRPSSLPLPAHERATARHRQPTLRRRPRRPDVHRGPGGARAPAGPGRRGLHDEPASRHRARARGRRAAARRWSSPSGETGRCTRSRTGCSTPASRTRPSGYVGQGTGGDFRRTLGIEHRLDAYVEAIASGRDAARRRRASCSYRARDGSDEDALVREHPVGGHGGPGRPLRVGDDQGPRRQGRVLLGQHARARGVPARPPAVRREPRGRHATSGRSTRS